MDLVALEEAREAAAVAEEARAAARAAAKEATRLQASGACEEVRRIVGEKGWVSGAGKLTLSLLEQVITWFNQPKQASNTVAEQIKCVQDLLGWKEGVGFPGAAPNPPPQPSGA